MTAPYFYFGNYDGSQETIQLEEDTSRHIVNVLRMTKGEKLNLTDGKGTLLECEIVDDHKKHSIVEVKSKNQNQKSKINT
jgi:16S rRNA (uracil1498-N3)-methyltransferase